MHCLIYSRSLTYKFLWIWKAWKQILITVGRVNINLMGMKRKFKKTGPFCEQLWSIFIERRASCTADVKKWDWKVIRLVQKSQNLQCKLRYLTSIERKDSRTFFRQQCEMERVYLWETETVIEIFMKAWKCNIVNT